MPHGDAPPAPATPAAPVATGKPLPTKPRIACVGHRGVAALFPENTLPSFAAALATGADAIELDVRLTKDNEVIVMHDPTLDRTTTGKGKVRDYTWAEVQQLRAIKSHLGFEQCFGAKPGAGVAERWPGAGPEQALIPRLVDVFDFMLAQPKGAPADVEVVIDIKWDNPLAIMAHINTILGMPAYAPLLPRITLGIWSPHFLWSLPPTAVPVRRMFIGANLTVAKLCARSVDTYSLDYRVVEANPAWVRRERERGKRVAVWTVDGCKDIARVAQSGLVDAIITDCVAQCIDVVRGVEEEVGGKAQAGESAATLVAMATAVGNA